MAFSFRLIQAILLSTMVDAKYFLNERIVKEEYRKKENARKLIDRCKKLTEETKASGLLLETSKNNLGGNVLCSTEGFSLVDESNFYFWKQT